MAYAAIASLSETIHLILNYHHYSISLQFKNKIASVHGHINFLRSFLEDFPDEADDLEARMREVINAAEDIIELLLSDSFLESSVGSSKQVEIRSDFDELERVTEEIESIAKEVKERHRENVGGFDDDLTQIISRLRGGSSRLETITIVGMGGIGKTTLARNAYNNPSIVEHFDVRAWATISQDFSGRGISLGLLGSMNRLNSQNKSNSEDELFESVYKILFGKRYLIVLDDLWNEEAWDMLQVIFPDNSNGSRILLTTRLLDVASCVGFCNHIHRMCLMNVDRSWNLLRQKIFKGDPCPPKLEYIGKMIARSCGGLPLAIEVVSGILATDLTRAAWEDIVENMNTNSINCDFCEHVNQICCMSYTYLPHHLRPCFLYLGVFREDNEIRVSKLIKLWAAEGFLNEIESKSLEETGEEYLEDLVKRSLVSVSKRKSNGRIKCFSIHDIIRDLLQKQSHEDSFFLDATRWFLSQRSQALKHPRRVSISQYEYDDHFIENVYGSTIRTVICLEGSGEGFECLLGYFRLLRILDLSNAHDLFKKCALPEQVFELIHLRYLAFDYPFSISKAISNLQNLQTLIIHPRKKHHVGIVKLPVEIWRMRQLRHVFVHSCVLPLPIQEEEEAMLALENLQTLTKVVDLICSRETLKMVPNLKKLVITFVAWRDPEEDCQLHNLIYLQKLENLKIKAYDFLKKPRRIIPPAFHPTLKELTLRGLRLPWEDMKTVGSLPNLQVLKLRQYACVGRKWETNDGGFSQLKFLLIMHTDLEQWITKSRHFPRLKCLVLLHCRRLGEVPNDMGEIPTLELIEVDRINKSLLDSATRIRDDQQSLGNDTLQVRLL